MYICSSQYFYGSGNYFATVSSYNWNETENLSRFTESTGKDLKTKLPTGNKKNTERK